MCLNYSLTPFRRGRQEAAWRLPTMQPILACLVVASASAFVAHAPRCVTSQAPRSASAKAVLSGLPDADEPLDFRKEINELKVITEGLAKNFTMLDQYFRDEISDLKPVTVVSTSRLLSLGTQETKAETETEQDPLAISAKDDTFPVCCSPLPRARVSRRGVGHPVPSLLPASHPRVESGKCGLRRRMESCS